MDQNDNFEKKPKYWERMHKKSSLFAITPLIPHLIIIALVFVGYYYINQNNLFPLWTNYIYWGMKLIIGFEVLAISALSLWGPILALFTGVFILFTTQVYDINLVTSADGWQLIIVSLIGLLVTIIIKL